MFDYEKADQNTYQGEYERQHANSGDKKDKENEVPMLYLKNGVTQVRILPPHPNANKKWLRHVEEHVMNVNGKWITTTCPRMPEYGAQCPICERGEELYNNGLALQDEKMTKSGQALAPRHNYLANVICQSCPDPEHGNMQKGVMVMKFGTKVKQQLLAMNQDVQGGWADITDLANGVDLRITRAGKGQQTTYTVQPCPQRTNIQAILGSQNMDLNNMNLFDLDSLYPPREYDALQNLAERKSSTPGFRAAPATPVGEPVPATPVGAGVPGNQPSVAPVAAPAAAPPSGGVGPHSVPAVPNPSAPAPAGPVPVPVAPVPPVQGTPQGTVPHPAPVAVPTPAPAAPVPVQPASAPVHVVPADQTVPVAQPTPEGTAPVRPVVVPDGPAVVPPPMPAPPSETTND